MSYFCTVMKKTILTLFAVCIAFCCANAQDNMVPFRHFSIGAEVGLHGLGVEVAMPIHERVVLKTGFNWASKRDLFNTDVTLDTRELHRIQDEEAAKSGRPFDREFGDEIVMNTGLCLGMNNFKAMVNWYPFSLGRFYLSGGIYYSFNEKDPFIMLSGYTTEDDWETLIEFRTRMHDTDPYKENNFTYNYALVIDGEEYAVEGRNTKSRGYFEGDFVTSQLKYYLGMGLGRCVPNKRVGLQLEVGAMIYNSATLYCQDKELESIREASIAFGDDIKEIFEYLDNYPVYPQLTMRISFRML